MWRDRHIYCSAGGGEYCSSLFNKMVLAVESKTEFGKEHLMHDSMKLAGFLLV